MIRKSHVALAALALVASGASFAQSNVKVYGLLDAGFGSIKSAHATGATQASPSVESGLMTTSFIGFAGSEDLGGGLKAEFAIESFLGVDDGAYLSNNAGNFWGRASNVALSGGFGKVALGQYDNPLFTFGYTYNPFGSSMAFSPTMRHYNYLGASGKQTQGITGAGVGFDTGWVNSITYETPSMSGFSGIVQYAPKETASSAAGVKNSYALGGTYAAGPLSASLVYVSAGIGGNAGAYSAEEKVWALGASYDFGMAKGFFQYTNIKDTTNTNKDKVWQLGVSVPVGSTGSVLASYGQLKDKATGATTSQSDKVLSLAYDHTLSKRTDAYVGLMHNSQSNTTNDKSGTSFAVGIRHNF